MKTWKWMGGRWERRNMGRGVREPQISAAISSSLRVMPWEGAILSRGGWVCVRLCVYILLPSTIQSGDALISTVMCTNVLLGRSTELSCNTPSFYDSLLFFMKPDWKRHNLVNQTCFPHQPCLFLEAAVCFARALNNQLNPNMRKKKRAETLKLNKQNYLYILGHSWTSSQIEVNLLWQWNIWYCKQMKTNTEVCTM